MNNTALDLAALRSLKATTDQSGRLMRPARALLGWMHPEDAHRVLVSNRGDAQPTEEQIAAANNAREAVGQRPIVIDQAAVEADLPDDLIPHVELLQKSPAGMNFFLEGWRVRLVKVDRLIAFQPAVFVDSAIERVESLQAGDLAETCLPIAGARELLAPTLDKVKNVWTLLSANPNLRVVGQFAGPVQPMGGGAPVFGFYVALTPSFVQVARFQGRYILRDGYHRALGLIGRGITEVPAFVRDFDSVEQLVSPGMLPQSAWLGARPPVIPDYFDNTVAATVSLPALQKLIIVQALEATVSA